MDDRMGKDGFENENLILDALNNKKFSELNDNLKRMVTELNEDISPNTIIKAYKKAGINKTDLIIEVNGLDYNISIKKGTGNSVHQEKVEEFIDFLDEKYFISEEIANDIRFFIWGDGTFDGTGAVSNRLSAKQFKSKYPKIVSNLKKFFYLHKRDLIERFVIKGSKSNSSPDFLYYGTPEKGIIVKSDDVLNWLADDKNEKTSSPIPIGRLTFQAWNRNINGGNKSENKRGVIQLKWSSVGQDLLIIYEEAKK